MATIIAFDSETKRFKAGRLAPPMICGSFSTRDEEGALESILLGNHEDDGLKAQIEWMLTDPDIKTVTQNGGFDYTVICSNWPDLIPHVFTALIEGRATDTLWREKLLNLSTTGRLDKIQMPDGSKQRISYAMEALATSYLGIDLSADKGNMDESWRANYGALDGWKAEHYPDEAARYAIEDAEHTLQIYEQQDARMAEWSMASTATEEFQLVKSFVLYLMTCWGIEVNREETEKMEAATIKVMEANKDLLEESGILRPMDAIGPPYKKDEEAAYAILAENLTPDMLPTEMADEDWNQFAPFFEDSGLKFKKPKGKPGSMNQKLFQAHLTALYQRLGEIPEMTEGGEKKAPAIKCDEEVREYLATKCPIMAQYSERKALAKIVTQMIPVLKSGPVVYPSYDAIKETGRTSSYDGGKVRGSKIERVYPSVNIQQIPNLIKGLDPRRCFQAREGTVFFDVDFTGLELACVGHITGELFGNSVHRNLYNAGVDLHGYLGAQLALKSSPSATEDKPWLPELAADFQSGIRDEGISDDPMAVYEIFRTLKMHDEENVRDFFGHFRKFAKPVGLGFPGGLGPATMVEFARKTYKVEMVEEEARMMRDFWRETYPEMPQFFDWINTQTDEFGESGQYTYTTPMGMIRRGASFCAAANGCAMQSPGAEAAMMGTILVSRACYDPTQESVLFGARPIAFVHDQLIGETTKDASLWADQCEEVARLMCEGAEMVLNTVKMRCDEALLTSVWSKSAEPVRDGENHLTPWIPKTEAA